MASGTIQRENALSGSNYCKMPDGTLLCWGEIGISGVAVTTAWGSVYESGRQNVSVSFPMTFKNAPTLLTRLRTSPVTFLEDNLSASTTGIGGAFWLMRPQSITDVSGSIHWLAVGRWK